MNLVGSRVDRFEIFRREFLVKRDDLLDPSINGNKARKFYKLLQNPIPFDTIISYGGVQSNAMYSLSALCRYRKKKFIYYVKKIPEFLKNSPSGNYKEALKNGMSIVELGNEEFWLKIEQIREKYKNSALFIPQGGAFDMSEEGLSILSDEIERFVFENRLSDPVLFLSSGTGTTAYFLHKNSKFPVYTTPCVGGVEYLKKQIDSLGSSSYPFILESSSKFTFGKPDIKLFEMYERLLKCGIEFDLLYDVKAWIVIEENLHLFRDKEVMFIHSGGTQANSSMIERYKYLNLIS